MYRSLRRVLGSMREMVGFRAQAVIYVAVPGFWIPAIHAGMTATSGLVCKGMSGAVPQSRSKG